MVGLAGKEGCSEGSGMLMGLNGTPRGVNTSNQGMAIDSLGYIYKVNYSRLI